MSDTSPPTFRFSPRAYEIGLFIQDQIVCASCEQTRDWRYTSSFYTAAEVKHLCPWCVADGTAARRFDGEFNDWIGIDGVPYLPGEDLEVDEAAALEVAERTPSYVSWQQEQWRSHCGMPCAFLGYVGSSDVVALLPEPALEADLDGGIGYDGRLLRESMTVDGDLTGYLFRCLTCGAHRLHADGS